jgi:hypothetical protein
MKNTSQARKQRRSYELWLKKNNIAAYKEWKANRHVRAKSLMDSQTEAVRKTEEETLEAMQTKIISQMKNDGKSNEEIDRYIGIWVKTLKLWATDEQPLSWKEAVAEYEEENK